MPRREKVPVTVRAVIQRINRKLKPNMERLVKARGERARLDVGDFCILNEARGYVSEKDVDVEAYARELGVLADWERVVEDE